ncbi:hypothetical protein KAR91_28450 [Candidatus Pacearchaeota archaeon]|nr:hypothetical protein [Candidatus Pacearchaeota archaeon]
MYKIDSPGNVAGEWINKNTLLSIPGTETDDEWMNTVQDEMINLHEHFGIPAAKGPNDLMLQAIIGQAVVGGLKTVNFASDANYIINVGTDEQKTAIFSFTDTGVLLTAARNVVVPDEVRLYLFENKTLQSLTIKTGAGAGVTLPPSTRQSLYCDGTDVVTKESNDAYQSSYIAAGTNAITLAARSGNKTAAVYTDGMQVSFKSVAAPTGAMTLKIGFLAVKSLVKQDGSAIGADYFATGKMLTVEYDLGNDRFFIIHGNSTGFDAVIDEVDSTVDRLLKTKSGGLLTIDAPVTPDLENFNASGFERYESGALNKPGGGASDTGVAIVAAYNNSNNLVKLVVSTNFAKIHVMQKSGGVWADPLKIFHNENVVGTVSESSGIPSGAVIESGSNANGDFVKYADGTMECWHTHTASDTSNQATGNVFSISPVYNLTFPAAFIAAPVVVPGVKVTTGNAWGAQSFVNATTATESGSLTFFAALNTAVASVSYHAKGRWY